jgi:hypothetical protein
MRLADVNHMQFHVQRNRTWVEILPLVSGFAANPSSSSGVWKLEEKKGFPFGNLGRDLVSYMKPLFFNMLLGSLWLEAGLWS